MKITVNKEYTTISQAPAIKEAIKEFKARYTDGDLLREYRDQTGTDEKLWNFEALEITGESYPAGSYYGNAPAFTFNAILVNRSSFGIVRGFATIYFHCDMDLNIRTDDMPTGGKMYGTTLYGKTE